jgi:hypothetical protein
MKNKPTPQKYYSLMAEMKATVYATMVNEHNQKIEFLEHPIHGDCFPIIVAFPEEKVAFSSHFYDLDDMMNAEHSDYRPFLVDGKLLMGFEVETI